MFVSSSERQFLSHKIKLTTSQVVVALQVHNNKTPFNVPILNKQHTLGVRRPKQSLNQAQPIFTDCQIQ